MKKLAFLILLLALLHGYHANAGQTQSPGAISFNDGTSFGLGGGLSNTTTIGLNNSAYGNGALYSVTSGYKNEGVGYNAGYTIATGYQNVVIGNQADVVLQNAHDAIIIGNLTKGGTNDLAIGNLALSHTLTNGNNNIGIGYSALSSLTTGKNNVALGIDAGNGITTGSYNTVVGGESGVSGTLSGNGNAIFGFGDATSLSTGAQNLILGYQVASTTLSTGSNNILIGTSSAIDTTTSDQSNFINIGGLYEGDTNLNHLVIAGTAPTVTSGATNCGTSPAIVGNDTVGRVTVGTSPSGSCPVVFHSAWTTAPICRCNNETSAARGCSALNTTTTSTALSSTTSPFTAADKVGFFCEGYQL